MSEAEDLRRYRYLLLDSPKAEEFFCKEIFDLILEPYQVLMMKLIRGRLRTEEQLYSFLDAYDLNFIDRSGFIGFTPGSYIRFVPNSPFSEIMAPGGLGKTTCLNMAATMEACDNPNSRNQLIFKNAEEGYSCSSVVRQYLELPQLVELFGRFVPADKAVPWSNKRFSLDQREAPDLRANFEFYGVNSDDALGKRSDRVIIDDAETTDTARTPEACAKLIEWVNTGPMTSPMAKWPKGADGRVVVPKAIRWSKTAQYWGLVNLGTIFHPKGLHAKFMNDPRFTVLRLDCFKDKSCKVSLNPKMQTVEDLEKMRRGIGTLVFNKRMRNIAYDPAEMAFQEVWIKGGEDYIDGRKLTFPGCLDYDRGYGEYEKDWELYLGFDPATGSTSRWSAYSAYVVLGVDPKADDRTLHIVDLLKLQCEHSRMLDHLLTGNPEYGIEGFLNKYPIKNAVVEKNNHGSMLLGDDRTKPWCDSGVIIPSYTTAQNKLDPEIGVFSMAALVENGKLRIPYRDPSDQEKAFVLIDDLVQFPKVKSDLVMALWLAQLPARKRNPYKSWFARGGHGKFYKNPAYR